MTNKQFSKESTNFLKDLEKTKMPKLFKVVKKRKSKAARTEIKRVDFTRQASKYRNQKGLIWNTNH